MLSPVSEPIATFEDWLQGRRPNHLSTNVGSQLVAFQTWRNFKEAFAPELIGRAYEETSAVLGRSVRNCIDPFGGSGTTAIACQFLGVSPITIEVNPFLADLIEAKVATYDVEALIRDFSTAIQAKAGRPANQPFPGAPVTFVEPGVDGRFVFHRSVAVRLARLLRQICAVRNQTHRRLMRVLLGSTALAVSNVLVSGKGRRYRRGWEAREPDAKVVDRLFEKAFIQAVYEIRRFQNRANKTYEVLRGDARELLPTRRRFDLAVFSPPYPNSFDYTDVYNVELWVCGYLQNPEDNRNLRLSTLRSHVQIYRAFDGAGIKSQTLSKVATALQGVRDELWNRHIPDMVNAYFADMASILDRLKRCIRVNGRIYMVVGDSRYRGVSVPVGRILTELATARGFRIVTDEPFRSMRSSPQQGGNRELMENLLVLGRA